MVYSSILCFTFLLSLGFGFLMRFPTDADADSFSSCDPFGDEIFSKSATTVGFRESISSSKP